MLLYWLDGFRVRDREPIGMRAFAPMFTTTVCRPLGVGCGLGVRVRISLTDNWIISSHVDSNFSFFKLQYTEHNSADSIWFDTANIFFPSEWKGTGQRSPFLFRHNPLRAVDHEFKMRQRISIRIRFLLGLVFCIILTSKAETYVSFDITRMLSLFTKQGPSANDASSGDENQWWK